MLKLTSVDWWTPARTDRQGVVCELPDEIPRSGEVPEEILKYGDQVQIDGKVWVCRGIEYFLSNPPKVGDYLSMMVSKS